MSTSQPKTPETQGAARKRVALLDDHTMMRNGMKVFIDSLPDFECCWEAADCKTALEKVESDMPDILLVDITLPDRNGLEFIKDVHSVHPDLIMLVISMHDESLYAERALRAGARGYVMKQEASESIVQAIRQVRIGGIYVSPRMTEQMLSRFVEGPLDAVESPLKALTDREMEVFHLIGEGLGISEIGLRLHLSVKTIGTYRERIKEKLNLRNSTELLRHAFNWVENEREAKQ